MPKANVNGIQIEYETYGSGSDPVVLMIHGLGVQLAGWDREFIDLLVGHGYRVVIFDNRDTGLSTDFVQQCPNPRLMLMKAITGAPFDPPYTLRDMAHDALQLLDALGVESAHVLGVSLGGMIAQRMAIESPERVRSLISVMSAARVPDLASSDPDAVAQLDDPASDDRAEAIEQSVAAARAFAGGGFEVEVERVRERAGRSYDRNPDRSGTARQMLAAVRDGDRRAGLSSLDVRALVIHGDADPLMPVNDGRETAEVIPEARLLLIEGMGHELPSASWPTLLDAIVDLLRKADSAHGSGC